MPPIGLITGGMDFKDMIITLKPAVMKGSTEMIPAVAVKIGLFLNALVDFVIVAFAIFMVIKAISALRRKQAEEPATPPAPAEDIVLLTEIRDALRSRS
jgi:large conductance mechanosensitive channel